MQRLTRRNFLRALAGSVVGTSLIGGWSGTGWGQAVAPLTVGVLLNQSGSTGTGENKLIEGIQLASDIINEQGGIAGRIPVKLVLEDGRLSPVGAVNGANRLVNRGDIGFVLGPLFSVQALATQPIFAAAGMAQIFFGMAKELTQQHESAPLSLRYGLQTAIEMAPVAKYAVEVNQQKNFFVLAQNSDVGRSYAATLRAALKQVGGRFVADPEFYPAFNRDFATLMTRVKSSGADALLMGTGIPVELLAALEAYKRQGLTPAQVGFYGDIALASDPFFSQAGITGQANGIIFSWIFDNGTDPRDFPRTKPAKQAITMTQAFIQRFGHPPTSETELPAWGWGGLQLISEAITGLIAEQGADRLAGMKPVGELPRAAIGYLLEGAAPDRPGRTLQTTFGDLGFFSCGQANILVGAATYKHGTRWLLRDREWAQALVPPLC